MVDFQLILPSETSPLFLPICLLGFASAAVAAWTFLRQKNVMGIKVPWKIPIFGITSKEVILCYWNNFQRLTWFHLPFTPLQFPEFVFLPQKIQWQDLRDICFRGSAGISSCLWPYLHSVSDDNGEHVSRCPHGALNPPTAACLSLLVSARLYAHWCQYWGQMVARHDECENLWHTDTHMSPSKHLHSQLRGSFVLSTPDKFDFHMLWYYKYVK